MDRFLRQRGKLIKSDPAPVNTTGWIKEVCVLSLGNADARRIVAHVLEELQVNKATKVAGVKAARCEIPVDEKSISHVQDLEELVVARMTTILKVKPSILIARKVGTADTVSVTCTLAS